MIWCWESTSGKETTVSNTTNQPPAPTRATALDPLVDVLESMCPFSRDEIRNRLSSALTEAGYVIVDKDDLDTVTEAMGATAHVLTDMQEWAEAMVARDRLIAVAWPESATADYLRIAGSHPDQLAARSPEGVRDGES